ncbi:MAG: class II aldolase/adducin family protein [Fimbriimonadaceae bacterium]|nr:class II aldolase/adducin family protein [Fimbriimonadaceae bacterium]
MDEIELRAALCETGRRLWQRGLVGASEGNLSVRLSPQRFLCTPSGASKGHLRPTDIVLVDSHGRSVCGGNPSSEVGLHVAIYLQRPDCASVIHAHPPYATSFAVAGEEIPDNVLPEAAIVLGSVAQVPFGLTGTKALAQSIEPYLADHKTFLLANHGAAVMGLDIADAYNRMETLERVAQVLHLAKNLGRINPMPDNVFDKIAPQTLHGRLS